MHWPVCARQGMSVRMCINMPTHTHITLRVCARQCMSMHMFIHVSTHTHITGPVCLDRHVHMSMHRFIDMSTHTPPGRSPTWTACMHYIVMADTVMAYTVMAYVVMAYIVMAYVVTVSPCSLCSYGHVEAPCCVL